MCDLKILIVEDEAIVAMEIKHRIEKMGHFVSGVAAFGEKAVQLAEETKPDLALMDINLKGKMNGIEAAIKIGTSFLIPSIFITAFADDKTVSQIKESTPYECLFKPFMETELKSAIERTMGGNKPSFTC